MKVYKNELVVRRNETFTIDKYVENRDGSPYIISNQLSNPYFLITVAGATYQHADRYVYHAWLPVTLPRFKTTVPVNIADFKDSDGNIKWKNFDNLQNLPDGYVNGVLTTYTEGNDALFYCENDDGDRIYKYWNDGWKDYRCRIVKTFGKDITSDWVEKGYFYMIELVSGTSVHDYLIASCQQHGIDYPLSEAVDTPIEKYKEMYEALKTINPSLVEGLNIERPLASFDSVYPLLETTKITVLSNLKGGM